MNRKEPEMLSIDEVRVCLIGLGNVGFGRYIDRKSETILDHFSAIKAHNSLNLICAIDKSIPNELLEVGYSSLDEVGNLSTDLLVVATATNSHFEVIDEFLSKCQTRMILLEKPGTKSLAEILKLKSVLDRYPNLPLFVNYQRNYNPIFAEVLNKSELGSLQCGVVHYSNGALNNATHALALVLHKLSGDVTVKRLSRETRKVEEDLDFEVCDSEGVRIVFLSTSEQAYSNFRIELDFEYGLVTYDSSQQEVKTRMRIKDPVFLGRFCLEENGISVQVNENEAFKYVYDFIVEKLQKAKPTRTRGVSLDLAIEIHTLLNPLRK